MADYQDMSQSGYLRILRFSPADDMIHMTTYSPNPACLHHHIAG